MVTTRILHASLFVTLSLVLSAMTSAQQCTRPVPPGEYPNTHAGQQLTHVRSNDQQIIDRMTRGTYGTGPVVPGSVDRLALKRRELIRRKVISQSAQLLAFAQELNAAVALSNTNHLSNSALKEAAKIEKLARSIEIKTRNAD